MAKSIMLQGVASNVGKTILTLALCRIFAQDGHLVAPFKAQNMTTLTTRTEKGDEIAVSAWLQAKAAGVVPCIDMAPIVIKPPFVRPDAIAHEAKLARIMEAYNRLNKIYDIIVIEGAGSPVELNLTKNGKDLVNMGMAKRVNAPVLLIGDIDRGGVFASIFGTLGLMTKDERGRVAATIINRFYGNSTGFTEGVEIIENLTGLPVAGVVPYTKISLPDEDKISPTGKLFNKMENFESQFDEIAEVVRNSLNMGLIYDILNNDNFGRRNG